MPDQLTGHTTLLAVLFWSFILTWMSAALNNFALDISEQNCVLDDNTKLILVSIATVYNSHIIDTTYFIV